MGKIALNKTGDHGGMLLILPSVMQFRIYRVFLNVFFRFGVVSLHSDDIQLYDNSLSFRMDESRS